MSRNLVFAVVVGAAALVLVIADEFLDLGTIGYAGIFVMGMACGIWIGGHVR